jgi:ribonuclease P protein subunit POP4
VFELHGNQFIHRAADRANKKFKSHFLPDLWRLRKWWQDIN